MMARPTESDVAREWPRIFRFLLKALGDWSQAEDLAQDTMAQALRALPGFRGDSALATWLIGIALNLARNHRRRAAQSVPVVDTTALEAVPAADDPEADLARAQVRARLRAAIDRLTPDFREPILLVALEEMSYADAALVLDVPVGTVRSRLSRARAQLRELLREPERTLKTLTVGEPP